jgi:bleomycin hydrolase
MKTKTIFIAILLLLSGIIYCQENDQGRIAGSWMGRITTPALSIRFLFKFYISGDKIKGYIDSPDRGVKDVPIDRVWMVNDSLFTDATKSLDAGIIFIGKLLPGDSVIDGLWAGGLSLRLSRTNFVYTLKTNLDPVVKSYKVIKLIKSSPIKDQQSTGYCWSYATTSFIETEAIRLGKEPVILSPIFYINPAYSGKAERYIRMNGKSYFDEGDLTFTALKAYKELGAVPESVFQTKKNEINRLESAGMRDSLLKRIKFYKETGKGWITIEGLRKDISGIVDGNFGKAPESFVFNGKNYTPLTFAKENVGINPDDYIEITSFTHHPFYTKFILEIESNWNNNYYLNLPVKDFASLVDYALMNNFSVGWDGDIHNGYNDGFAVLNDSIVNVTQQDRQSAFDNHTTEDVHNMHIIGIAENDKGKRFYILKNSSDLKDCGGYVYMSKEFFLQKTISVMINKEALPTEIKSKLGFKL